MSEKKNPLYEGIIALCRQKIKPGAGPGIHRAHTPDFPRNPLQGPRVSRALVQLRTETVSRVKDCHCAKLFEKRSQLCRVPSRRNTWSA
jgi:hypothetical protein